MRHVQQELFRHGGKRKGAGRKSKHGRPRSRRKSKKRPTIKPYHALHVVMPVVPAVGSLRRRSIYKAMRDATITAALRERFRIVHVSIQRTHVHMLVEAENTKALSRGMQGFEIAAAHASSRRLRRRFFQEVLHFSDQVHAVLLNGHQVRTLRE